MACIAAVCGRYWKELPTLPVTQEICMSTNRHPGSAVLLLVVMILINPVILAQETATTGEKELGKLWEDFLHGIKVARPDLARSNGQAILDSGAPARELYALSVQTRGAAAVLARGARLEGMKEIVAGIQKMIEEGYEEDRSDPQQIADAIEMLGGTIRGFEIAARRLAVNGEYALPQLIQKLVDPRTPGKLRENIIVVLPRLGKDAVRPLTVALKTSDPALQEVIANALGLIAYPHAAPHLRELLEREGALDRTKRAAKLALIACAGEDATNKSVAALYHEQALSYYYQKESVAPDIRYATANVWYWTEGLGLTYKVVPREIFCDVYAMRMVRLALEHDKNFYPAVSLWIAANLKRQADLPEGQVDPTYGEDTPSAEYFALASSAKYLQDVLGRALRDRNSAVAVGAIDALAKTSGAKNLAEPVAGGAQPLVEALSYGDRHVRFMAALSLANALPSKKFGGYQLVLPQLVEALRQTGQKTALLIVADDEPRNALQAAIRAAGWVVIAQSDPDKAIAAAHLSTGVDAAVLAAKPDPLEVITRFRRDPAFVTLPVVVAERAESLRSFAEKDNGRTILIFASPDADAVAAGLTRATQAATGIEVTPEAAADWTIKAANAIYYLGITENKVFDIKRAESALIAVLQNEKVPIKLVALRALSVMHSAGAQRAIARLAVSDEMSKDIRIAAFKDLSASLRRYGNQLDQELSQAIIEIVSGKGSPELLNAAAQVLGAMSLPSEKINSLIVRTQN
jgi:HEAT repeat protein